MTLAAATLGIGACAEGPHRMAGGIRRIGLANVHETGGTLVVDLEEPASLDVETRGPGGEWESRPESRSGAHHEVDLGPLEPDARTAYRIEGAEGTVTTPGASREACALVVADPQGGEIASVLPDLTLTAEAADLVLSLGDHVGLAGDPVGNSEAAYLDYLLGPLSEVTARIPLYAAFGNHDAANTQDPEIREAAVDAYAEYMVLPEGEVGARPELVYSFDWGPLHVAVLDSVDHDLGRANGIVTAETLDWLARDMAGTDRPWKVVALHHMIHGWEADPTEAQADWFHVANADEAHAAFVRAGVSLVLSGHRHAYDVYAKDGILYLTFPPLSPEMLLGDRYGPPNWTNVGGSAGTIPHAFGEVFGWGMLCATADAIDVDVTAFEVGEGGLPVPADVPAVRL
jgi:predicted phosphodiesterase